MADIFISYAKEEKSQVEPIAKVLEKKDWSVWWDPNIPPGTDFDEIIEEQLSKAGCVIVIWSKKSVKSKYVKGEAREGLVRNILLPIAIEANIRPPLDFRSTQTVQLIGWDGSELSPEFKSIINGIEAIIGSSSETTKKTEELKSDQPESTISIASTTELPPIKSEQVKKYPKYRKISPMMKMGAIIFIAFILIGGGFLYYLQNILRSSVSTLDNAQITEKLKKELKGESPDLIGKLEKELKGESPDLIGVELVSENSDTKGYGLYGKRGIVAWQDYAHWLESIKGRKNEIAYLPVTFNSYTSPNVLLVYLFTNPETIPFIKNVSFPYGFLDFPSNEFIRNFPTPVPQIEYILFFDRKKDTIVGYAPAGQFSQELLGHLRAGNKAQIQNILNGPVNMIEFQKYFHSISKNILFEQDAYMVAKEILKKDHNEIVVVYERKYYIARMKYILNLLN